MMRAGLSAAALIARDVDNARTSPELVAYRTSMGRRLASYWKNRPVTTHPVIREYHRVHKEFGELSEAPAPEKLLTYVRRNRDFTASGAVVDCYNIVSARTLLSIGAHDLEQIAFPVTLRQATTLDSFVALGTTEPQFFPHEYAYVDAQHTIICRADVLQCEQTKATRDSRNIIFLLQGNQYLPGTTLLKGAWLLSELITRLCGGKVELVSFFDAGGIFTELPAKPLVPFDAFKLLRLVKATLLAVKPLTSLPALSCVTLDARAEVKALALTATLPAQPAHQGVLVALDLHPLVIAGETFTSYLPALHHSAGSSPPAIDGAIPNGTQLY
jgi:DNA/RNA-binding domain of Phe-tRNA-synthetase-like protein